MGVAVFFLYMPCLVVAGFIALMLASRLARDQKKSTPDVEPKPKSFILGALCTLALTAIISSSLFWLLRSNIVHSLIALLLPSLTVPFLVSFKILYSNAYPSSPLSREEIARNTFIAVGALHSIYLPALLAYIAVWLWRG